MKKKSKDTKYLKLPLQCFMEGIIISYSKQDDFSLLENGLGQVVKGFKQIDKEIDEVKPWQNKGILRTKNLTNSK